MRKSCPFLASPAGAKEGIVLHVDDPEGGTNFRVSPLRIEPTTARSKLWDTKMAPRPFPIGWHEKADRRSDLPAPSRSFWRRRFRS